MRLITILGLRVSVIKTYFNKITNLMCLNLLLKMQRELKDSSLSFKGNIKWSYLELIEEETSQSKE
jgi:hypothetical protein